MSMGDPRFQLGQGASGVAVSVHCVLRRQQSTKVGRASREPEHSMVGVGRAVGKLNVAKISSRHVELHVNTRW